MPAFKVFRNQGVVRCLEAVLHGQVKRGWCLATAADSDQDDIRVFEVAVGLAVVMRQRKVDGFNTGLVFFAFAGVAETAHTVVGFDLEFIFKRVDKGAKHVEQHALATVGQHFENFHVHHCRTKNGLFAVN